MRKITSPGRLPGLQFGPTSFRLAILSRLLVTSTKSLRRSSPLSIQRIPFCFPRSVIETFPYHHASMMTLRRFFSLLFAIMTSLTRIYLGLYLANTLSFSPLPSVRFLETHFSFFSSIVYLLASSTPYPPPHRLDVLFEIHLSFTFYGPVIRGNECKFHDQAMKFGTDHLEARSFEIKWVAEMRVHADFLSRNGVNHLKMSFSPIYRPDLIFGKNFPIKFCRA